MDQQAIKIWLANEKYSLTIWHFRDMTSSAKDSVAYLLLEAKISLKWVPKLAPFEEGLRLLQQLLLLFAHQKHKISPPKSHLDSFLK